MEERSDVTGGGEGGLPLTYLSKDCIVAVVAFTSPKDACAVAAVSKFFNEVADSNAVWEKFLPPDYHLIAPALESWLSKKRLYRWLCNNRILIDGNRTSLSLDKGSGKWCYMLSARGLTITWSSTPEYWTWISLPDARFPEVAELLNVCWFQIKGRISTARLSPDTLYLAFLVFKRTQSIYGFTNLPIETEVGVVGSEPARRIVRLMVGRGQGKSDSRRRNDGWLEVELGEFFNRRDLTEELQLNAFQTNYGNWKSGLIIQGIELRPCCQ